MNIVGRQSFDLSSGYVETTGVGNALGYQIVFDADLNGNATGAVQVFENDSALALLTIKAGTIRTGALSGQGAPNTRLRLQPVAGSQGIITCELTDEPQPMAAYTV